MKVIIFWDSDHEGWCINVLPENAYFYLYDMEKEEVNRLIGKIFPTANEIVMLD